MAYRYIREFNGKPYVGIKQSSKSVARREAKERRARGQNARVIETKEGSFVYWRYKDLPGMSARQKATIRKEDAKKRKMMRDLRKSKMKKNKSASFEVHQTYSARSTAERIAMSGKNNGRWDNYRIVRSYNRKRGQYAYTVEVKGKKKRPKNRYA